ncbi:hypothetical protein ACS0TY_014505 [Phlomoides rotata]
MSFSQLKRMVFSVSWVVLYIPCKYQNEAFTGSLQEICRSCGDLGWFGKHFWLSDTTLFYLVFRELLEYALSVLILDEIQKLMSRLDLVVGFSEFSRFYGFIFFNCRENGQKILTVSRSIMAWRLVLSGRKIKYINISEDPWRQVFASSRCVHENLEGYDPEGAWPILIDEFVEYMYMDGRHSLRTFQMVEQLHKQPYKGCIRETFKDFLPTSLALIETLIAIDPDARGTATSALNSEVVCNLQLCTPLARKPLIENAKSWYEGTKGPHSRHMESAYHQVNLDRRQKHSQKVVIHSSGNHLSIPGTDGR